MHESPVQGQRDKHHGTGQMPSQPGILARQYEYVETLQVTSLQMINDHNKTVGAGSQPARNR
jgi:hypothetical protein